MTKTYTIELTKDELKALNDYLSADAQDVYDWEILCSGKAPYDPAQLGMAHEKVSTACAKAHAKDIEFYFTYEGEYGLEQYEILASDVRVATVKLALEHADDIGADGAVAWYDPVTHELREQSIDW